MPAAGLVTPPDRPADVFHQHSKRAEGGSSEGLSGRNGAVDPPGNDTCRVAGARPDPLLNRGQDLGYRGSASSEPLGDFELPERSRADDVASLDEMTDPSAPPIRPDDDLSERPGRQNPGSTAPSGHIRGTGRSHGRTPQQALSVERVSKIRSDERLRVRAPDDLETIQDPIGAWKSHSYKMRYPRSVRDFADVPGSIVARCGRERVLSRRNE